MSLISTEMDSPVTKVSVMERWAWASEALGRSLARWVWARSTVETVEALVDPTGVGGGATAPAVLHGSSGALLVGGFPSAAASPRTDWMRASTWPGWMAGWSFGFGGDAAVVGGPASGGWVGGSDGSDDAVAVVGRGGSRLVGGGSAGGRYGCLDVNDLACS